MRNKKNKGFTLIELLIVIAIIGILAAVLIPNLLRAREVAVDRAAEAYARNVYTAAQAYIAEDVNNVINADVNCLNGITNQFGEWTVDGPGNNVTACTYREATDDVQITWSGGTNSPETDVVP